MKEKTMSESEVLFYKSSPYTEVLFQNDVSLLPSVSEIFELELAYLEYTVLSKDQLIERSAYLKSINGSLTNHFLMYNQSSDALIKERSISTKNYFQNGTFATGYATHGLFPYRGKFHPQLIKGLLNIIGIKQSETILDPMCGSGTANIEAALMGINSYAIDVSPFCQFMTQVKYDALKISIEDLSLLTNRREKIFKLFNNRNALMKLKDIQDPEKIKVCNLGLLAFLDSMGYSKRVVRASHKELFFKVLDRYVNTVSNILKTPLFNSSKLGDLRIFHDSNALGLKLEDNSIDAVVTSPPYSFAIDYAKNDAAQLEYLGYNVNELKERMIGLNGKNKTERLQNYFKDMKRACFEMHRVLKNDKFLIMIIGSNTNQTGGIRLENTITENCEQMGFQLVKSIIKPIKGIRNTMKDEHVLIFRKLR